ncbi:MAG: hypothetical protein M1832_001992 [Thelocarpon impressellum]|nr:MAG: hypothetical protein M1832_001992 [Thelocarpon impressellum]
MAPNPPPPIYPLYNTTFTLHRLSPLHHDDAALLTLDTLSPHAGQLRDILRGEVLRGVRVGLSTTNDEGLGRAGALQSVEWTVLGDEASWLSAGDPEDDDELQISPSADDALGIHISIAYERSTYTAILLRTATAINLTDQDGFTHLPLLLTRMPAPLRETLLAYFASSFDARASPLLLSSSFLTNALETFLGDLTTSSSSTAATSIIKDLSLTLSFPSPASPLLKTLEIALTRADVPRLLKLGRHLALPPLSAPPPRTRRSHLAPQEPPRPSPFTAALSHHLSAHLALTPLSHAEIRISRIACAAFVVGAEGKAKVFAPPPPAPAEQEEGEDGDEEAGAWRAATASLVRALVKRAKADGGMGTDV